MVHPNEPASRLIWIYAIAIGAFYGTTPMLPLILAERIAVTEQNVGYFVMYLGAMGVIVRTAILGRMIEWLGEAKVARLGLVFLAVGLAFVAAITSYPTMLIAMTLMPIGTGFCFPASQRCCPAWSECTTRVVHGVQTHSAGCRACHFRSSRDSAWTRSAWECHSFSLERWCPDATATGALDEYAKSP